MRLACRSCENYRMCGQKQKAWSCDHFGHASTKHAGKKRHGHHHGQCHQSACAGYKHPVDCAGERQGLEAAADPISDERSQRASEAVNFPRSCLPLYNSTFGAAKRALNRKHGSALAALSKVRSSETAIPIQISTFRTFGASHTLATLMHLS
jgi:hypothetical protein